MARMSTRAASGRPLGVTVVVALTAVVAVLDVVAGTVVLIDAARGPPYRASLRRSPRP